MQRTTTTFHIDASELEFGVNPGEQPMAVVTYINIPFHFDYVLVSGHGAVQGWMYTSALHYILFIWKD